MHRSSNRVRPIETGNDRLDLFNAVMVISAVGSSLRPANQNDSTGTRKRTQLLTLTALRHVPDTLTEPSGVLIVVDPSIYHVVPRDIGIKIMCLGLFLKQSS